MPPDDTFHRAMNESRDSVCMRLSVLFRVTSLHAARGLPHPRGRLPAASQRNVTCAHPGCPGPAVQGRGGCLRLWPGTLCWLLHVLLDWALLSLGSDGDGAIQESSEAWRPGRAAGRGGARTRRRAPCPPCGHRRRLGNSELGVGPPWPSEFSWRSPMGWVWLAGDPSGGPKSDGPPPGFSVEAPADGFARRG